MQSHLSCGPSESRLAAMGASSTRHRSGGAHYDSPGSAEQQTHNTTEAFAGLASSTFGRDPVPVVSLVAHGRDGLHSITLKPVQIYRLP
jgi:hypothetical protein